MLEFTEIINPALTHTALFLALAALGVHRREKPDGLPLL